MNENTKKALKITGICLAVLAAVFLIVMMFFLLSFAGAFGYDVQSLTLSYAQLQEADLAPLLVKQPSGAYASASFTVYTDGVKNSKDIARGKVECGAYSWETPLDFFCAAETKGSYTLHADIFIDGAEKVGTNASLGDIFVAREDYLTVYYAEKDGVRYAYVPLERTLEDFTDASAAEIFNKVFLFE